MPVFIRRNSINVTTWCLGEPVPSIPMEAIASITANMGEAYILGSCKDLPKFDLNFKGSHCWVGEDARIVFTRLAELQCALEKAAMAAQAVDVQETEMEEMAVREQVQGDPFETVMDYKVFPRFVEKEGEVIVYDGWGLGPQNLLAQMPTEKMVILALREAASLKMHTISEDSVRMKAIKALLEVGAKIEAIRLVKTWLPQMALLDAKSFVEGIKL